MMRVILAMIALMLFTGPLYAAELEVDLAENHVDITTGFTGDDLVLFGTKDPDSDVAITIKGPLKTMVVRRKDRVLGLWMNRTSVEFTEVPGYYNYALSDPALMTIEALAPYEIGTQALPLNTEDKVKPAQLKDFRDALIRNKQAQNLFPEVPQEIIMITDEFFRTRFNLPPNVPVGDYQITTYLIRNGQITGTKGTSIKVAQIGTSATVNEFARTRALLYGILCIIFAVSVGWLSYAVKQRLR